MSPVTAGRFVFEPALVDEGVLVAVLEADGGQRRSRGRIFLSAHAWRELREILAAPILRPVSGASRERLTVPLVEHLRRVRT